MGVISFFCALYCLCELVCSAVSRTLSGGYGAVMLTYGVLRAITLMPVLLVRMLFGNPDYADQAHDLITSLGKQVQRFYTNASNSQAAITGNSFI